MIEEDGDYYFDLKKCIQQKIDKKRGFGGNSDFEKKKEIECLNEWVERKEVSDENKRKSEDLKIKGNEALKSGDWEEALNYYKKSLEINPANFLVYGNMAYIHI